MDQPLLSEQVGKGRQLRRSGNHWQVSGRAQGRAGRTAESAGSQQIKESGSIKRLGSALPPCYVEKMSTIRSRKTRTTGPTLPPGVTPQKAASAYAWMWLQGQSNHRRREHRRQHKARVYPGSLLGRWLTICCPYQTNQHPGAEELASQVLGVTEGTAHQYLLGHGEPSVEGMRALARWLRRQYADVPALIVDLEWAADQKAASIDKHVPRWRQPGA
jgi:hypothetical protein